MPKSRVRGGAKAHRKRVQSRSKTIKQQISSMQKLFNQSMQQQLEELKKQYEAQSGTTETTE